MARILQRFRTGWRDMISGKALSPSEPGGAVLVAAAQAVAPLFDIRVGVAKCCHLIAKAAAEGARLVVFPESFLPGFPIWSAFYRPIDAHGFFRRFAENSLNTASDLFGQICAAAARNRIMVCLGFSEVSDGSRGCLWNSQVLIGEDGAVLNHHRKLVPTFYEQLTWNRGDAAGLRVVETPIGRVGGLICGENNNPVSRYVLMSGAEEIHCAGYPSIWPFRNPNGGASYDLRKAIYVRAAAHSFEAKVFTIVSASVLDEATIATVSEGDDAIAAMMRHCPQANSMIIAPMGDIIAELPAGQEGLLVGEIDVSELVELKQHHDMAGYYHRSEIFRVSVVRDRPRPLDNAVFERSSPSAEEVENGHVHHDQTLRVVAQ
jgi:nitrilase